MKLSLSRALTMPDSGPPVQPSATPKTVTLTMLATVVHPLSSWSGYILSLGALPYKRYHTNRYFGTGTRYSRGPIPAVQRAYTF